MSNIVATPVAAAATTLADAPNFVAVASSLCIVEDLLTVGIRSINWLIIIGSIEAEFR